MRHPTGPLQRRSSLPDLTRISNSPNDLLSPIHIPESPFPLHVQLYLGSCRTKCLADIHGASISQLGGRSEACRKELEKMSLKMDGRRGKRKDEGEAVEQRSSKTFTPFLSIANTPVEPVLLCTHPTPQPTITPPSPPPVPDCSDSYLTFLPPPKPSLQLQAFLNSATHRSTKSLYRSNQRTKKHLPSTFIGRFSLPRKLEQRGKGSKTECSSPSIIKGTGWPMSPTPGKGGNGFSVVACGVESGRRRGPGRSSCG